MISDAKSRVLMRCLTAPVRGGESSQMGRYRGFGLFRCGASLMNLFDCHHEPGSAGVVIQRDGRVPRRAKQGHVASLLAMTMRGVFIAFPCKRSGLVRCLAMTMLGFKFPD